MALGICICGNVLSTGAYQCPRCEEVGYPSRSKMSPYTPLLLLIGLAFILTAFDLVKQFATTGSWVQTECINVYVYPNGQREYCPAGKRIEVVNHRCYPC